MTRYAIGAMLLCCAFFQVEAQNVFPATGSVGVGTTAPHASSLLEVKSTGKGVLLPRMTSAQKNAIVSPATGLLVFQTDSIKGLYYFESGWKTVAPSLTNLVNRNLSNLTAPTSINADLLPATNNARHIGSLTRSWKNLYLTNALFLKGGVFLHSSGPDNIFLGLNTGTTISGGNANVGIGSNSLAKITTGNNNTALGYNVLSNNNVGAFNTAIGSQAMINNSNGEQNTAVGSQTLSFNSSGNYNAALGHGSLYRNAIGNNNTAVGFLTLANNTNGNGNTAAGVSAIENNIDGENNSALGRLALWSNTSGSGNTALGAYALWTNEASSNNTAIGSLSGVAGNNATAIGYGATATASNQVRLGNASVTSIGGQVGWTNFSDGRFKKDVQANVPGLAFIEKLRPVTYRLDASAIDARMNAVKKSSRKPTDMLASQSRAVLAHLQAIQEKEQVVYTGFVAQEVEAVAKTLNYDFSGIDKPKGEQDFYGLRYSDFVMPLVRAVQELNSQQKGLQEEIVSLKEQNKMLEERLNRVEALLRREGALSLSNNLPISGKLGNAMPNPNQGMTTIKYEVKGKSESANLLIVDTKGSTVRSVALNRNDNEITLDLSALAAGAYSYVLLVDSQKVDAKTMIVAR